MCHYKSLQFRPKPHTDHEPSIVTGRAVAPGSVADSPSGALNNAVQLPEQEISSGHDQSHILVSFASRWRDL
jgi:hypothetical protein